MIQSILSRQQSMLDMLHQFCTINSGTDNLAGLERMRQALERAFSPIADSLEIKKSKPVSLITMQGTPYEQVYGDILLLRKRPELARRVLLCGHMDTVYSSTHPFQTLHYQNDNHLVGPGVADMKGGLIVILEALRAFEQSDSASLLGWDVIINADEETGSKGSAYLYKEMAKYYQAALVYEPAMTPEGTLAKNRKGSGKLTLIAKGKAAHAGRAFDEGRNAICYLAEIIVAVNALNGQREGLTINVGKIAGGEALNVVPDTAVAKLDIRISQPEDEHWLRSELQKIHDRAMRSGYALQIDGSFDRPVKRVSAGTQRLYERLQLLGKQMGITVDWKDSGGCCDGNNLAELGLPVLDTLGVRGGQIHSGNEFILLDSLAERSILSALLLSDLAAGGLEDLNHDSSS